MTIRSSGMLINGIHFRMLSSKIASENDTGLIIKIIGLKKDFFYNSSMKNQYLIKSTIFWSTQDMPVRKMIDDPPSEIYGWARSFIDQLKNWVSCINEGAVTENVPFLDGLKEQKDLFYFLSKKERFLGHY